jgi:hypothetical protein
MTELHDLKQQNGTVVNKGHETFGHFYALR